MSSAAADAGNPDQRNLVPESEDRVNITVQRWAAFTCIVALLPISIGALVTTLKAGMAFADWPTSDGHNMLLYPWLRDLRHTDKFVEHGHRLAGILIGVVSIALVVVTWLREKRRWVRMGAVAILIAVIAQGLLGGARVRMDAQTLAMVHSVTGGLFFSGCFLFAVSVRRHTTAAATEDSDHGGIGTGAFFAGLLLPLVVFGQYILGGFFRHLGRMLHEHVAGAVLVVVMVVAVVGLFRRTRLHDLQLRSRWLGAALLVQVGLGLGSWVTKMGFPPLGWVASVNSPAQNITCSLHTVGGMFLLATSCALAAELIQLARQGRIESLRAVFGGGGSLSAERPTGGLA